MINTKPISVEDSSPTVNNGEDSSSSNEQIPFQQLLSIYSDIYNFYLSYLCKYVSEIKHFLVLDYKAYGTTF